MPTTDDSFTQFVSMGNGQGEWIDIGADGSRRLAGKNMIKGAQVLYSILNAEGAVDIECTLQRGVL